MKTKIILACCILVNYSIIYAMEHVPLISSHKHNHLLINTIQDIPKLSLANIGPCFNALPDAKRDQLYTSNNKQLSRSLTFNITLLPQELIYKIVTHILDGDEKSANIFFNIPLWYAYKRYDEAQKKINRSSLKINNPIRMTIFNDSTFLQINYSIAYLTNCRKIMGNK